MAESTKDFLNPFAPEALLTRKDAATAALKEDRDWRGSASYVPDSEGFSTSVGFSFFVGLLGTGICALLGWHWWLGWVLPALLVTLVTTAMCVSRLRLRQARQTLAAAQTEIDRHWKIRAPKSVSREVGAVIAGIQALPATERAEFRPVMDAVADACEVLRRDPTDGAARARIAARAEAVTKAVTQVQALEEALRQQEWSVRYRSDDDSDLVVAQTFTAAIEEARRSVARVSTPLPLSS